MGSFDTSRTKFAGEWHFGLAFPLLGKGRHFAPQVESVTRHFEGIFNSLAAEPNASAARSSLVAVAIPLIRLREQGKCHSRYMQTAAQLALIIETNQLLLKLLTL